MSLPEYNIFRHFSFWKENQENMLMLEFLKAEYMVSGNAVFSFMSVCLFAGEVPVWPLRDPAHHVDLFKLVHLGPVQICHLEPTQYIYCQAGGWPSTESFSCRLCDCCGVSKPSCQGTQSSSGVKININKEFWHLRSQIWCSTEQSESKLHISGLTCSRTKEQNNYFPTFCSGVWVYIYIQMGECPPISRYAGKFNGFFVVRGHHSFRLSRILCGCWQHTGSGWGI